jgi:EmrB/QacA subfamily drug resistance transporter
MTTRIAGAEAADLEAARHTPSIGGVLACLSLSMLLSALGTSIASVGLPTLAHAFGAAFQDVQWIVLAYLLATTSLIVGAGRLGDLIGRRRVLLAGLSVFTAASVLAGAAPSLTVLVVARALQGAGAAAMMALTMAFVADTVPKTRTGRAMGLLGTMSAVGTALGPSLGGMLIAELGWRSIFVITVPLGVLALGLALRVLPPDRARGARAGAGFDGAGTVLLAVTLAAYSLAMTWGRGAFGPLNLALLGAAALGAGLFVRAEMRAAAPLIRWSVVRSPVLGAGLATSALVSTVVMATLVVGPFYLARGLGLDAAQVGLVLSVGPLVAALTGVPAGRLVDRFGASRLTIAGLGAMVAGAVALAVTPSAAGVIGYAAPLVGITAGYALFQAANNTAVMRDVPADRRGVVSGLLNLARNLGLISGAAAMGAVFALGAATADVAGAPPAAVAAGLRTTFGVAAGLIALALLIARAGRAADRSRGLTRAA